MRIWNSFISYANFYKKQIFRYDIEKKKRKKRAAKSYFTPSNTWQNLVSPTFHESPTFWQTLEIDISDNPSIFQRPTKQPPRYEHSEFRITTRMARKKMATASNPFHHLSLSLSWR